MYRATKTLLIGLIGLGSVAAAPVASAACGYAAGHKLTAWQTAPSDSLLVHANLVTPTTGATDLSGARRANLGDATIQHVEYGEAPIIGMWSFTMTAGGGTVDFGYTQWHDDGTELMNSGGRAPASENFCMGVWRRTGPSHFHLNHFALSYDSNGVLNAKVNIKEDVIVDRGGSSYSGPFTLDVYDPKSGALLQHIAGQVTAQRVPAL